MNPRVSNSLSGFWQSQRQRADRRKQQQARYAASGNLYSVHSREGVPEVEMRTMAVHTRIRRVQ